MFSSFWFIGLCAVILSVYISTLSPSIAGGDSGELVAEGCILGTGFLFLFFDYYYFYNYLNIF